MRKKKKSLKTKRRFIRNKILISKKENKSLDEILKIGIKFDLTQDTHKVINLNSGGIIPNASIEMGYFGSNKDRTTFSMPTLPTDYSLTIERKFHQYKHIFAIDTNNGSYNSLLTNTETKIGLGFAIALNYNDNQDWQFIPIRFPFIALNHPDKFENENWINLIKIIQRSCDCNDKRKIGIIVDSDLGNLADYNKRKKSVIGNEYLDSDFELIFASDKVNDLIFNKMIRLSHKISKKLLPDILKAILEKEKLYS